MNDDDLNFKHGAVRPIQCFREGWQLIKDEYWLFLGISFVGMLIGGAVPFGILLGPMWCGIEICLLRRMRGQRINFNFLFEGFNFFGPSVVATLFVIVPAVVLMMLSYVVFVAAMIGVAVPMAPQGGGPPDASAIAVFIGGIGLYVAVMLVLSIAIGAPLIFMYGLIVDRGVSGVEAVKLSLRSVWKSHGRDGAADPQHALERRGIVPIMCRCLPAAAAHLRGVCGCLPERLPKRRTARGHPGRRSRAAGTASRGQSATEHRHPGRGARDAAPETGITPE